VPAAAPARPAAQKKRLVAAERDEAARAAWRAEAAGLDPADLVFLDETSTHTALTRPRARAPRGERAVGRLPRNRGPNVTLLAALGPAGIGEAAVVEGAVDGAAFAAYLEQFLVPSLRPGQVVVLDNLSVHRGARARALVEGAGCRLLFLPAYSPDFNPIEPAFAKVKQLLRRAGARSFDALVAAIGAALDAVTPADARAFFAHCGYPLPDHQL
jgi:transposase